MELNNWLYFREIQIDATNININLTDWLVAIKLDSNNFDFSKTQPSGADIRFTDSDKTTSLDYWIENYDTNNQKATIWVKIPSILANSSKSIYIWYGNPNAITNSNITIISDPFNDNSCLAFYPFDGDTNDYSGNGYHGTWYGNEQYDGGVFGQCAKFDGESYIETSFNSNSLTCVVYSFWLSFNNNPESQKILGFSGSSDMAIQIMNGTTARVYFRSNLVYQDVSNFFINDGSWHHYLFIIDNNGTKHYRDGTFITTTTQTISSVTTPFRIGLVIDDSNLSNYYNGLMDQTHIFNRPLTEYEILSLSQQLPYSIGDEIFHGSKLSGVVCDKYGIPIVDKPVKIFIFDKDSGKLYRTTTSDKGKWEADHLPVAENSKVLVVYTLEGNYREDNDLVGGEFSITQPL